MVSALVADFTRMKLDWLKAMTRRLALVKQSGAKVD